MKLPKFKNPLQAAADFAQRMAGEAAAPAPEERRTEPTPPPPVYGESAPVYEEAAPVYEERHPVYEEPPVYTPPPQPKKQAPRRKSTPLEDIGYTLWALAIAVSVAATALTFLIGAIS